MTTRLGWPLIWMLLFMLLILAEGIAIGQKQPGVTLSEVIRHYVRFDPVGRPIFLTLWCWLTYHWILRPSWNVTIGWRDLIALGLGIAWSVWEAYRR
jgi:hypothetical protein